MSKNLSSYLTALVLALLLASCQQTKQDEPITGIWIGTAEMKPYPELISFIYDSVPFAKLYYHEVPIHQLEKFKLEGQKVSFEIDQPQFRGNFNGELLADGSTISGQLFNRGNFYPCTFIRLDPVGLDRITKMNGYYQLNTGQIIEIEPFLLELNFVPISLLDFGTGRQRIAFPTSQTSFVAGQKMLSPYPTQITVDILEEDSSAMRKISWKEADGTSLEGELLPFLTNRREIEVDNGDVTLRGTIIFPNTEGPHPLVVFVPAAGEQYRGKMFDDYIKVLPYQGVAVLVYDKRGCGNSTGDLQRSSFSDFAGDLVAMLEDAARQDDIDPKRIGVMGIDQAGMIMPIALSQTDKASFMVSMSGATVSMEEQEYEASRLRMAADGFGEQAIAEALDYQKAMFSFLKGQIDSASFQRISDEGQSAEWASYVTSFDKKNYMDWWRKNYDFTPMPYLKGLKIPILAIYGEVDLLVPPAKNEPLMQEVLAAGGHQASKTVVLPKANHLLLLGETRGDFQFTENLGYAPELFPLLHQWIRERVGISE